MAEALQHDQTALVVRISTTGTANNEPIPDTARSGRANAINSLSRWYKISVRSVQVIDSASGTAGRLSGVTLSGFGSVDNPHTYYYTDQFGALSQTAGGDVLTDTSGHAILNAAATSDACTINLTPGAVSTIAGGSLTIAQGTVVTTVYAGAGNDVIIGNNAGDKLYGGDGNDQIFGGSGNDTIHLGSGSNTVNGGAGVDVVVLPGSESQYNVQLQGQVVVITNPTSGVTDQINNAEVVQFADTAIFNVASSSEAAIVNIYEAALDRAPDAGGFQFWLSQFRTGQASLSAIANAFINSSEFATDHGTISNSHLLNVMYENTLARAPTQSELTSWLSEISSQHLSQADLVVAFAETPLTQIKAVGIVNIIDGQI